MRWMLLLALLLAASALSAAPAERWDNGLRLIVRPMTSSGLVSAELLLDYSAVDEPVDMPGLRQVLVTAMMQGSKDVPGAEIRRQLTNMGGTLQARVQQEVI